MTATCCSWCGHEPSAICIVVSGPGVAICENCVELVTVIIEGEKGSRSTD